VSIIILVTLQGNDEISSRCSKTKKKQKMSYKKAVLSQGEPHDAAVSNFTTAACGFSATSRLVYTGRPIHQRPFKLENLID